MNEALHHITSTCFHCSEVCMDSSLIYGEKQFCCRGCYNVYSILHNNQLDEYYCLNESPGQSLKNMPSHGWNEIDLPEYASRFILFKDEHITRAVFYLPQIHCSSCLWLLEHINQIHPAVISSQVNFNEKKLYISFNNADIKLSDLANLLESIGYKPFTEKVKQKEKVSSIAIVQIGVAGFCFANIMMLSFPEYLGLNQGSELYLINYFRWISLSLSLPLLYISTPAFFSKAWKGLKHNYVNIELPISLAIIVTFSRSLIDIGTEMGSGYLDSMSGIVFFMLLGRYIQDRTNFSLNFSKNFNSYFPFSCTVKINNNFFSKPISEILENEILVLKYGEILPVDGVLSKGRATIDYSYITGESENKLHQPGDLLYAGGRVVDVAIELLVIKPFSKSNFMQMWNHAAFQKADNNHKKWTDALGKYFTFIVLGIALSSLIFWMWKGDYALAWRAATSVLIVACPCALLLSTGFTYGFMTNILNRYKIFIKNHFVFDTLTKLNQIVFDKTGTLTYNAKDRVSLVSSKWNKNEKNHALNLLWNSNHPMSKSVLQYEMFYKPNQKMDSFIERPGLGIEGWIDDHHYKIGKAAFVQLENASLKGTFVQKDQDILANYIVSQDLKPQVTDLLHQLNKYKLSILTGDIHEHAELIRPMLPEGIKIFSNQTPTDKLHYIEQLQSNGDKVMMIGDGLNDAGALKQSDLGVAISEDHFSFTPSSDIIIEGKNINKLSSLILVAKQVKKLILLAFLYSLAYNLAGIYFSVRGELSPMVAAILMPLSSIGVIGIAWFGTQRIGQLVK